MGFFFSLFILKALEYNFCDRHIYNHKASSRENLEVKEKKKINLPKYIEIWKINSQEK